MSLKGAWQFVWRLTALTRQPIPRGDALPPEGA
jgi:hypothetical protein